MSDDDDLNLSSEEQKRAASDLRKAVMAKKFESNLMQGVLPFTNEDYHEQVNSIVRSSLFTAGKISQKERIRFDEWIETFTIGSSPLQYRGPALTIEHETVWVKLIALARGRSIFDPVMLAQSDILEWLRINKSSGNNYVRARRILEDLSRGEIRISSRPALERVLKILQVKDPEVGEFTSVVRRLYGPHMKMLAEALYKNENAYISLKFFGTYTINESSKRVVVNLDPLAALFFDGIHTTLVPFWVLDDVDRFSRKILTFIASHRDGVYPMKLEVYHSLSGSRSDYQVVKRRFKQQFVAKMTLLEEKGYIEPGWSVYLNKEGEYIVSGLKISAKIRLKAKLTDDDDSNDEVELKDPKSKEFDGSDLGSDEASKERLRLFAEEQGFPDPTEEPTKH